jgi:hypothetical protein
MNIPYAAALTLVGWSLIIPPVFSPMGKHPRRILRICRRNIAYNSLPYNFTRMLLLPRIGRHHRSVRPAIRP